MPTSTKVAIVTGSNKGIGLAIVKELCKKFDGDVYLTARNESLGKSAVSELEKEGLHAKFHQLDVTDEESVISISQFIKTQYGGLDVLVNNAGIYLQKQDSTEPFGVQAEETLKTNYWGVLTVSKHLLPLVRSHGRVVHVSSTVGIIALNNQNAGSEAFDENYLKRFRCSTELELKLKSLQTIDKVSEYMKNYVKLCQEGKHKEEGWADSGYAVSKAGLCLITPMQQKLIDQEKPNRSDIIINSCCPGYVATDLNNHAGPKTVEEGRFPSSSVIGFRLISKSQPSPGITEIIEFQRDGCFDIGDVRAYRHADERIWQPWQLVERADTPVYLALLPPNAAEPRGKFVRERQVMDL